MNCPECGKKMTGGNKTYEWCKECHPEFEKRVPMNATEKAVEAIEILFQSTKIDPDEVRDVISQAILQTLEAVREEIDGIGFGGDYTSLGAFKEGCWEGDTVGGIQAMQRKSVAILDTHIAKAKEGSDVGHSEERAPKGTGAGAGEAPPAGEQEGADGA